MSVNTERKLALPRETVLNTLHMLGYTEVDDYDDATLEAVLRLAVADHAAGIDARLRAVEEHDRLLVGLVDSIENMVWFFYRIPLGCLIAAVIAWILWAVTGFGNGGFVGFFSFVLFIAVIVIYLSSRKKRK